MKPVLFVTGHAPAYRVGAFRRLAERENVEFALFGGRLEHGGGATARELGFPHRHVRGHRARGASHDGAHPAGHTPKSIPHGRGQAGRQTGELYSLASSGRYRAVVCSTGGRLALLAAWAGARRARVPLILWASLWAHPRSLAHVLSYPALLRLYRSADAVVTYGPHVSAYVRARGGRRLHVAPQAVDNGFWSSPDISLPNDPRWPAKADVIFLFAGRPIREKGLGVLEEAWSTSGLQAPTAALVLVGAGSTPPWVPAGGAVVDPATQPAGGAAPAAPDRVSAPPPAFPEGAAAMTPDPASAPFRGGAAPVALEAVSQPVLRNFYAAADVLVVPSIPTRTFREPWGLVVNEAMNRGLPVIASDAVGAAAGGLVQDGRNGLVVPAGDAVALAAALRTLATDPGLRARMGRAGRADVSAYTYDAWAQGFSDALAELGLSVGAVR